MSGGLFVFLALVGLTQAQFNPNNYCICRCQKAKADNPNGKYGAECILPNNGQLLRSFAEGIGNWNPDIDFKPNSWTVKDECTPGKGCKKSLWTNDGKWKCGPYVPMCQKLPLGVTNAQQPSCTAPVANGGTCQINCKQGYQGSGTATCVKGQWTNLPTCTIKGCSSAPANPSNGNYAAGCANQPNGFQCVLTCNSPYVKSGDSECVKGVWDTETCIKPAPANCKGTPPPIPNGHFGACANTQSGKACPAHCNAGFTQSGPSPVCNNGKWPPVSQLPKCIPKPCKGLPPHPKGGKFSCTVPMKSGGSCTLKCSGGKKASGKAICTQGTWSPARCVALPPTCNANTMYKPVCAATQLPYVFSPCAKKAQIPGKPKDRFGNTVGTQYDLIPDNVFSTKVLANRPLICLWNTFANRGYRVGFGMLIKALRSKGFQVSMKYGQGMSNAALASWIKNAYELWVFIPAKNFMSASDVRIKTMQSFWKKGGSLYILADNDPHTYAANNMLKTLLPGVYVKGNFNAQKFVGRYMGPTKGIQESIVTSCINKMQEGHSTCNIYGLAKYGKNIQKAVYGTSGNLVTALYQTAGCGRMAIDCAWTRFHNNLMKKDGSFGSARFAKNMATWLLNYPVHGPQMVKNQVIQKCGRPQGRTCSQIVAANINKCTSPGKKGLKAWYTAESKNGADMSGNGLTIPTISRMKYMPGYNSLWAYDFSGSGAYMQFSNVRTKYPKILMAGSKTGTWAVWLKTTDTLASLFEEIGGCTTFRFGVAGGKITFLYGYAACKWQSVYGSTRIDDGGWHHIAAAMTGSQLKLWIDGCPEAQAKQTGTIYNGYKTVTTSFGKRISGTHWLHGLEDDIRLYNRALSDCEVARLAKSLP